MSDVPLCAHSRVSLVRADHGDGSCHDTWECSDCKTRFVPVPWESVNEITRLQQKLAVAASVAICGHPASYGVIRYPESNTVPGPSPVCSICEELAALDRELKALRELRDMVTYHDGCNVCDYRLVIKARESLVSDSTTAPEGGEADVP